MPKCAWDWRICRHSLTMCPARYEMKEEALLIHCTRTFASLATTQRSPTLSIANWSLSKITSASASSGSVELTGFAEISNTCPVESLPIAATQEELGLTLASTLILIIYGSGGCQACLMGSAPTLSAALCRVPTKHTFVVASIARQYPPWIGFSWKPIYNDTSIYTTSN